MRELPRTGTLSILGHLNSAGKIFRCIFFSQFPIEHLLTSISTEPLSCVPIRVASLWLTLASNQQQLISLASHSPVIPLLMLQIPFLLIYYPPLISHEQLQLSGPTHHLLASSLQSLSPFRPVGIIFCPF